MKFFRKDRVNTLRERKFSKYLVYALGEVILIMVGVLLAMQASILNEKYKEEKNIIRIYSRVLLDIDNNIQTANKLINEYEEFKYMYTLVINDSITPSQLNEGLAYLVTGYLPYDYDQTGVNQLIKADTQDSTAIKIIRAYDNAESLIKASEDLIIANVNKNLSDWSDNHAWFQQYVKGELSVDAQTYFLSSQDYKNKVSFIYLMMYDGYLESIKNFSAQLVSLKAEIESKME